MGSSTMIDIVGSMLIGGLLLLTAVRMDERATSNTFQAEAGVPASMKYCLLAAESRLFKYPILLK